MNNFRIRAVNVPDPLHRFADRDKIHMILVIRHKRLDLRYAGDATENVIWRMENGQLEGYRARRFVVKAGHHNSRFDSRSDKAKAVERIVELIKLRHKESLVEVEK